MPYEVTANGQSVAVAKSIGTYLKGDGTVLGHEIQTVIHESGKVLEDSDIAPYIIEAYEKGEAHARFILKKIVKRAKKVEEDVEDEVENVVNEANPSAEVTDGSPVVATKTTRAAK